MEQHTFLNFPSARAARQEGQGGPSRNSNTGTAATPVLGTREGACGSLLWLLSGCLCTFAILLATCDCCCGLQQHRLHQEAKMH
jgi:hypothetical protein